MFCVVSSLFVLLLCLLWLCVCVCVCVFVLLVCFFCVVFGSCSCCICFLLFGQNNVVYLKSGFGAAKNKSYLKSSFGHLFVSCSDVFFLFVSSFLFVSYFCFYFCLVPWDTQGEPSGAGSIYRFFK